MIAPFSKRADRRGTVLVIVIWSALGLIALALYFAHTVQLDYRAADNALAGRQAEQAIDGTRRYLQYVLTDIVTPGERPSLDNADYFADALKIGEATVWLLGRDTLETQEPTRPTFMLMDEASKLNVNTATADMLELLPNMTLEIAAAIVDWRDADSEIGDGGGAEEQEYNALDPPYSAKNSAFESIEELRLVRGVDTFILYGEDVNRNGILDSNENDGDATWPPDNGDGRLDGGLADYLTTFTREPNTQTDGSQRINIASDGNTQRLQEMLTTQLGADRASAVMSQVQGRMGSFTSPLEFYKLSGMSTSEFSLVEGALTTTDASYRIGLVNPATASRQVLACLPGLSESVALELISARSGLDDTALQSTAWVGDVLDETAIQLAGPYLTAQAWQFGADITAVGANGRGFRRMQIVIDTEQTPRVIYQRDLSRFGWPLGRDLREAIRNGEFENNRRL